MIRVVITITLHMTELSDDEIPDFEDDQDDDRRRRREQIMRETLRQAEILARAE